jgi:hypothetical protein
VSTTGVCARWSSRAGWSRTYEQRS